MRRTSIRDLEPQFGLDMDNAKDIFSGKRRKVNGADNVESTQTGQRSISSSEMKLRAAVPVDDAQGYPVNTEQYPVPDTDRGFNSARGQQ